MTEKDPFYDQNRNELDTAFDQAKSVAESSRDGATPLPIDETFVDSANTAREFIDRDNRELSDPKSIGRRVAKGAAVLAVAGGAIAGINYLETGASGPEIVGELNPSIESLVIKDNANIRNSPQTDNEFKKTLIITAPSEIVVETPNGAYELNGTNNGNWLGINSVDIVTEIPELSDALSEYSVVYINEAGIISVEETSPDTIDQN